jgi:hypothetical protein
VPNLRVVASVMLSFTREILLRRCEDYIVKEASVEGAALPKKSPTSLRSSLDPSTYGQKVTWTATVTPSGSLIPTGKVQFRWSIYSIGSATLDSSGVATLIRSNLNADTYPQ